MKEATVDRRVRKTKKILRECLTQLLKEKKIQDITVRELTEMADLNRGTFYLHYKDVFDLLEQTEEELLTAFRQLLNRLNSKNTDNELVPVFEEIFSMVKENGDLVEILLGENGDLNFLNRLKALIREKCLEDWMEMFRKRNSSSFEACSAWLQSGMKQSPRELAVLAERLFLHGIESIKES